ncbi:type I polyketide synthase [Mycobacterium sp. IS-1590]|uniref:sulfolipid-1 biosynthesis phthioceranic/hydroxyphthioceranic acid synthase n=1 Tax=Mycobacterium sp. IS-1590 TaxID=1772286 RepID=UPI0009E816D5|nr:type I polyketide synthase [Mycobacterium sp. IS-1590]
MNNGSVTPVAVIGMACRLPGGIDSPEQLWEALVRGEDMVTEIPRDRWDADEYYDPEPGLPGRSVSKWGAFLEDVAGFDSEFFGIGEDEATPLDPQQRLLLETSWEAIERAGLARETVADSRTGVFVGLTDSDYQLLNANSRAMEGPYGFPGNTFSLASGRIAYTLGLRGPALTLDTADSSSLTAVHLACRSLNDGESDLALAGGAFVMLDPRKYVSATAQGQLSPTGGCHAFDVAADGYAYGEASAVVLLKRLPDALRDGDRILAVVRGTAVNQDGHSPNIFTPSPNAQTAVYRAALAAAGVEARTIGMVEAHGTGVPAGDSVEFASLAEVYGLEGHCALTSVKTNFGHTQSASGVLGLMKTILALGHGTVPPNLHFTALPDELARIATKLAVPQELIDWPTNGQHPRRAAVSSYGASGTNAHAILEQAPEAHHSGETEIPSGALLFPLSATSAEELRRTAGRLADWLQAHDDVELSDLAYTLARRRGHRPVRTAVIASSRPDLTEALHAVASGDAPYQPAVGQDDRRPVWMFSGQGSPSAADCQQLLATEPVFAATVAQIEPLIARESGFSVTEAMSAPGVITGIELARPTLFTMQVAVAATMKAYGAIPGAVIGHSLGETAAAVVAGALSLEDGVRVVCRRSQLMSRVAGTGAMASLELPAKQVLSELTMRRVKDVAVAMVESPQSTVIGGAAPTVRELVAAWQERDVVAHELATDVAVHSPEVDPIRTELADVLAELRPVTPEIPFYSATQFDPREEPVCDSRYWADNLRQTVRFAAAVRAALEDGYRVFAELDLDPLLTHAVEQTAGSLDLPPVALPAIRREQLRHGLRGFIADIHSAGAAVDFSALCPTGRLVDAPLPTWTHRRLWLRPENQESPTGGGSTISVHPLLGAHVRVPEEPERHVWQGDVGTDGQPWLGDHRIRDVAVLPGAAFCEMALAAARTVLGETAEVRDLRFEQAALMDGQGTINASASVASPGVVDFTVETSQGEERVRHATAVLHGVADGQPAMHDMAALQGTHTCREEGAEVRKRLEEKGIQYGPAFTGLGAVYTGEGQTVTALAQVAPPRQVRSQRDAYVVHPAVLDACFQSVAAHLDVQAIDEDALALPLALRRLRAYSVGASARYCYTRIIKVDASVVEADLDLLDEHGAVLISVEGLQLGTRTSEETRKERVLGERLLTIEWRQRRLPDIPHADTGTWLLIGMTDTDVMSTALAEALKSHGARCTAMTWASDGGVATNRDELENHLRTGGFTGVVVLTGPQRSAADEQSARLGRDYVQHLVHLTRGLAATPVVLPYLYVVTRGAQTVVPGDVANLEQAGLRGLIRVIGAEQSHLRPVQIDVDETTDAQQLAQQLLSGSDEDETAWRDGQWYVARLSPAPLRPDERRTILAAPERDGMRLQIRTPGDMETLELVAVDRVPPGPGQIEVAVGASSINFADALHAMGRLPSYEGAPPQLGMDFAGVVTAVGPGVADHHVGGHVGGLSADGCWGTFLTCDARLAVPRPAGLSEDETAAVTTAHATAWYGLHDLARIGSGDKVLIHSATGGVGQAAIAIARNAGAEIFATAGSEERRQLLRDMGIEHVYDSRSIEFAEAIRRDTGGYGVDIVLNSATGAARRAGVDLLALGGRFVEIGNRDLYDDTRWGLSAFRRNLAFYSLDLALMTRSHPDRIRDLLHTVYRLVGSGELPILQPTQYRLTDAATALRLMSGAQHAGRLVLDIRHAGPSRAVIPPARMQVFRRDGAYLVTGGMSTLGLFLAEKMARGGCGRIVLSSPSEPDQETLQAIERIRATGADVVVECGDIADAGTAQRLVAAATATGLPVRGVLHLAAVVDDATLSALTDELIERHWAPKVYGAWNLHTATAGEPVDWFCSFSSAAALVGSPAQGAYAAANSWLDTFSLWRRAQGLPSIAIAWGGWANVGGATALAEGVDAAITPDEGAYAFEALLRHDRGHTAYAPYSGVPRLTSFAERSPFAEAFLSTGHSTAVAGKLRTELDELPVDEWPARLRRLISDQISVILRRSIDPDRPLAEYGVDSLGALELRTRLENETGIRLTASDIGATTVRDLAVLLSEKLAPAEDS